MPLRSAGLILAWVGAFSVAAACDVRADIILTVADEVLDAIRVDRTSPPKAARAMAMVHVAAFDAFNAIDLRYDPFLPDDFNAHGDESPQAAVAAAAHAVLVALFPAQQAAFDSFLNEVLNTIPAGDEKDAGVELGQRVAAALLARRAADGSADSLAYTPGTGPGFWQPTPAGFAAALLPQWGTVDPFCVADVAAVRRPAPPSLTSSEYTSAFNEVKLLGAKNSTSRTAEETSIAFFWVDGPGTATPPGHWFQIARDVSIQQGNTLDENARLFALLGLAVCDAGICAWDNKFAYNHWRPVTAIRAADTDNNPATEPDPTWELLIPTPPFPAFTSGHSTFSGAGSKVLALFYGTDEIAFTTTSDDVPGQVRAYQRFSQAANEAGRSRIYGGIHWEYDNQEGLASGREIALEVYGNFLKQIEPDDENVVEVPLDDVTQCGTLGLFPLGLVGLGLLGAGCKGRRNARSRCPGGTD